MSLPRKACCFGAFLALSFAVPLAQAIAQEQQPQDQPGQDDSVELAGDAIDGVAAVNLAAGSANQQANVGIIAMGDLASAVGVIDQALTTPGTEYTAHGSAEIADGAFANSNGWIAANLAAGSANQQANINLMATGLSGQVASATVLGQIRGPVNPPDENADPVPPGETVVRIGDGAFQDSSGLVQLNLVAGDRNSTANLFAMTVTEPIN
jgi:hypothetical protein